MHNSNFWNGKKVFVTGHTGFKGTWFCVLLEVLGADVYGYALEPPVGENLFTIMKMSDRLKDKSFIGDVRNQELLSQVIKKRKPDIVFHMAAQPIVRESYKNPVYTYDTNVMGTVNVLEALREVTSVVSFVNITTDKVYFNVEKSEGYKETDTLCGHDPYSNSKSCSEMVTHSYKSSFFNSNEAPFISTARSGNVVGGGDFSSNRILPDCIRSIQKNEMMMIRNPKSIRPYQHVLDCLRGYLLLAEAQCIDKTISGSYNFGPEEQDCVATENLVELFCRAWNKKIERLPGTNNPFRWTIRAERGPLEANTLKLDCSKAKAILKWEPVWHIENSISKVVDWTYCYMEGLDASGCLENQVNKFLKNIQEV